MPICGHDFRSGPRDACPNSLHDYPLPTGYVDASVAADRRLEQGWLNPECPDCRRGGWSRGEPTGDPCDERVSVPTVE